MNFSFPVNTQPVAQNDAFDTGEDVSIQLDVLANDSDADGD
ncbi:MAG: Ig-like domain-containing protein [Calditrichia bacterium]